MVSHLAVEVASNLGPELIGSHGAFLELQEYAALLIHAEHIVGVAHACTGVGFNATVAVDVDYHTAKVEK